ncbi:MAG: FliO/MopB family protein [Leptospirillia bacterium]
MITPSHGHEVSLMMIGAKLLGSLFFVLALFLIGVWLVRLLQKQKLLSPRRSENEIEIRSTRSLGPKSQIALVSVAGNSFLVGVAPSGISLLGKVEENVQSRPQVPPSAPPRPLPVAAPQPQPSRSQAGDPTSFDAAVREALDRIGAISRERTTRERAPRWTV